MTIFGILVRYDQDQARSGGWPAGCRGISRASDSSGGLKAQYISGTSCQEPGNAVPCKRKLFFMSLCVCMQFYAGGVFLEPACSRTRLTQSVLVIGYGRTKRGRDYWILKNRYRLSPTFQHRRLTMRAWVGTWLLVLNCLRNWAAIDLKLTYYTSTELTGHVLSIEVYQLYICPLYSHIACFITSISLEENSGILRQWYMCTCTVQWTV